MDVKQAVDLAKTYIVDLFESGHVHVPRTKSLILFTEYHGVLFHLKKDHFGS
jgi:hypothetical protein